MKYSSDLDQNVKEMVDVDSAKFLNNLTNTSTSDSQNFTFIPHKRYPLSITRLVLQRVCITWISHMTGVSIQQSDKVKNDMPTFGI